MIEPNQSHASTYFKTRLISQYKLFTFSLWISLTLLAEGIGLALSSSVAIVVPVTLVITTAISAFLPDFLTKLYNSRMEWQVHKDRVVQPHLLSC